MTEMRWDAKRTHNKRAPCLCVREYRAGRAGGDLHRKLIQALPLVGHARARRCKGERIKGSRGKKEELHQQQLRTSSVPIID